MTTPPTPISEPGESVDVDSGVVHVHTASGSVHILDLDDHTYQRARAEVPPGQVAEGARIESVTLRRDGEVMTLESRKLVIVIGESLSLALSGVSDDPLVMGTTRSTAPVTRVEQSGRFDE